jgi:hypothetical protein
MGGQEMTGLNKITIHWDAGHLKPTLEALQDEGMFYHFLVDGVGKIHNGKFKPEDNISTGDGKYAAHCGGGNTGNIGVAFCGMYNFTSIKSLGKELLTQVQCEAGFKKIAQLCKQYKIDPTPENVFTHYEFGQAHRDTTSYGKIDITYLPTHPQLKANEIGNFIREKVLWYLKNT